MPEFETTYEEGLDMIEEAVDMAEGIVIDMGLPLRVRPKTVDGAFDDRPTLPPRLSDCNWVQLQDHLGQFTAWYGYANEMLPLVIGRRNAVEKQMKYAWSRIRKTKSGTVSDKDDATQTDRRYLRVVAAYEKCDLVVRFIASIVEGLKREIDTISRVATIKDNIQGTQGLGSRVERRMRSDAAKRNTGGSGLANVFRAGRNRGKR